MTSGMVARSPDWSRAEAAAAAQRVAVLQQPSSAAGCPMKVHGGCIRPVCALVKGLVSACCHASGQGFGQCLLPRLRQSCGRKAATEHGPCVPHPPQIMVVRA